MKIAFLTYGTSPVPATKGGAVENLIEDLLDENEEHHALDMTVFSIYEEKASEHAKNYKHTNFKFVKCPRIVDITDKLIYLFFKYILKRENLISYRFIVRRLYVMAHYPRMLLNEDYDKIILVTNATLFFVLKNKKVYEKYRGKVVYYLHNEVRSLFRCEKEAASICALVGISQFVNSAFQKQVPSLKDEDCYVLKNCIDTEAFSNRDETKIRAYRNKFGLSEDDFVVIFAGRIVKEKGAMEVIEAVKASNRENIKLLIVGGGFYSSDVIDKYALKLRALAEDIKHRIIFTGYIDYSDMPTIYALGNVAVLPSIWEEPAGMTMVEAVIAGTPLITTNSGGIPEYIPKGAAIILERDEHLVDNIISAICDLMDNPEKAKNMSEKGSELKNKLNLEMYYKNFVDIILNL